MCVHKSFEFGNDIGFSENEEFLFSELDLKASVFGEQNLIANLQGVGDRVSRPVDVDPLVHGPKLGQ